MNEETEFDASEWETASMKKMISYSFGWLFVFFMGGFFNTIVFYYYEVELGLPIVLLGLAFVIFAVWNMINDPLIGYLTDRKFRWSKKWGFRAPWMMIAIFPYLLCWWLIFAVPDSIVENSDPWPLFWYFVIISCLFDTFYSLFSTHIGAGYTTYFRTDAERKKSSAVSNIVPQFMSLFLGFMLPLFYVYGDRSSMIFAQTIIVLLLVGCLILFIPSIRESDEIKEAFLRGYETTVRDSYFKTMKSVLKRKNFMITMIVLWLMNLGGVLAAASGIFFLKDVLQLPMYNYIFMSLAGFLGFVLFIPFWYNISKKYGHVKCFKLSLILSCFGYLNYLWVTTLEHVIITSFIGGFIAGSYWTNMGPVNSDVFDDCTIAAGKHQEAIYTSVRTFFYRISLIAQAVIFVIVHVATGYNPDPKAVQTDLAILGIRIHAGLIPSILALLAFIIMSKYYDLIGEKQEALKVKLKEMGL